MQISNKNQDSHLSACSTAASTSPGLLFQVPRPSKGILAPELKVKEVSILLLVMELILSLLLVESVQWTTSTPPPPRLQSVLKDQVLR